MERAANTAVDEAVAAGQPQASVDELQATADEVTAQRNTLFKGETLRGLLLSAFAWSTVGTIAGIAAHRGLRRRRTGAVLVVAGIWHLRRMHRHGVTS